MFHAPEATIGILHSSTECLTHHESDTLWRNGVFAWLRSGSGQPRITKKIGPIKVSFQRRPSDLRQNHEEDPSANGLLWEPIPGRNDVEVKSHFRYMEQEKDATSMPRNRESTPRRMYTTKVDVAVGKYGPTAGCR